MRNFKLTKKIFLISVASFFGFLLYSNFALAAATYNSLVEIPCLLPDGCSPNPSVTGYLSNLYSFLISAVGIVAMGAIVIGGARYLTSVGNPSAIEDAKHTIYSAIYGLILALVSWVIINTINPDILVLKNPAMPWSAVGYTPAARVPQCAMPVGGVTANDCKCRDGALVTIAPLVEPVVLSSSIASCATSVLDTTPSITIIFNKPVNLSAGAVILNPNTPLSPIPIWNKSWTDGLITSGNNITLTFTGVGLSATTTYVLNIDATKTKDSSGTNMAANYTLDFTTRGSYFPLSCTPYVPPATDCNSACADPANFHCGTAELGVGASSAEAAIPGRHAIIQYGKGVYIDVKSGFESPYVLGKVLVYHSLNSWLNTIIGSPSNICILDSRCKAAPTDPMGCSLGTGESELTKPELGKFITGYSGPDTHNVGADFYVINPATGLCDISPIKDREALVTVEAAP